MLPEKYLRDFNHPRWHWDTILSQAVTSFPSHKSQESKSDRQCTLRHIYTYNNLVWACEIAIAQAGAGAGSGAGAKS